MRVALLLGLEALAVAVVVGLVVWGLLGLV